MTIVDLAEEIRSLRREVEQLRLSMSPKAKEEKARRDIKASMKASDVARDFLRRNR